LLKEINFVHSAKQPSADATFSEHARKIFPS